MRLLTGTAAIDDLDSFLGELDHIGSEYACAVQAFDARYVAGPAHLERAVTLANRATGRGEAIARKRSVEILLYAAGRRQINRAFEIGIEEGEQEVVIVVDGEDESGAIEALSAVVEPADWGPGDRADEERITEFYAITDDERAATDASLEELVRERVALLVVER
ncbi:KEOPS complex subunit Cgi121 [Halalkalicoccus sp. NIPERK01]|uniref:KEOPS complex subunit Cgi121 n=1 Tax=Halalkalicoccus sp. NIPERK01 TaxID=3053469 RepID=UPI00256F20BA|nr:KEOPS complex subunit Cgi121 [Halalkalicoccus sp. NIPERK01]MDL5362936.1 KEOPS complex subunit Cgi121 [Halalkalicoccus sp. NIPERK01]